MNKKLTGIVSHATATVEDDVAVQSVLIWLAARTAEIRKDPDRGEILERVVLTAVLVAATILVAAIIINKAKDTANNIQTQ